MPRNSQTVGTQIPQILKMGLEKDSKYKINHRCTLITVVL